MIGMRVALASIALFFTAAQNAPADPPTWFQRDAMASHYLSGEQTMLVNVDTFSDSITVNVTIDATGNVIEASQDSDSNYAVARYRPQWIETAVAMVRRWRFKPFVRDGRTVSARGRVTVYVGRADRPPTRHVAFPAVRREDVVMRLEHAGCFWGCGAYSIEIRGDGSVLYSGAPNTLVQGERRYTIPVERVDALIRQFREADFWSLDDVYRAEVTDQETVRISFSAGGKTKTLEDYVGRMLGMPRAVSLLEDAIDEAADAARWASGNARTVPTLAAEGYDFTTPEASYLFWRVASGESEQVAIDLLDRGVPIDVASRCPNCPGGASVRQQALYSTVERGRVALFDRLDTDAGFATISQEMRDKLLMRAARARSPHMVARLLARGAKVSATDAEMGSALIQALSDPYGRIAPDADQWKVVQMLLDRGAPLELRDRINWTALQHCYDDEPRFARLLIARGAQIDAVAPGDQSLLYLTEDEDIALIALKAGADPGLKNHAEQTLAEIARRKRWPRVQRLLAAR